MPQQKPRLDDSTKWAKPTGREEFIEEDPRREDREDEEEFEMGKDEETEDLEFEDEESFETDADLDEE